MAGYIQGAVLRLLRVYLSPYVENLDDDQLSLGFKAGEYLSDRIGMMS